jgi:hypothetical protein
LLLLLGVGGAYWEHEGIYNCWCCRPTFLTARPRRCAHRSACMHQKHLLRFIKSKLKKEPDEVVIFR